MDIKKLYALLIILIVLYIGLNIGINGFSITETNPNTSTQSIMANAKNSANNTGFPNLDNFTATNKSDTYVKYVDNNTGVDIEVQKINNSENVSDIYKNLSGNVNSSQEINQKGVTAYLLYNESQSTYDTEIYFNKNNQNYKISGVNITYENSDYFINSCKQIIGSI